MRAECPPSSMAAAAPNLLLGGIKRSYGLFDVGNIIWMLFFILGSVRNKRPESMHHFRRKPMKFRADGIVTDVHLVAVGRVELTSRYVASLSWFVIAIFCCHFRLIVLIDCLITIRQRQLALISTGLNGLGTRNRPSKRRSCLAHQSSLKGLAIQRGPSIAMSRVAKVSS